MDGNSSSRGRHRHRATPGRPARADESPQWSPSTDRPQWTPPVAPQRTGPEWTAEQATAERRTGRRAAGPDWTGRQDAVPGSSGRQWTAEQWTAEQWTAEQWTAEQGAAEQPPAQPRTGRQGAVPGWAGQQWRAQQGAAEQAAAAPRTGRQDAVPEWSGRQWTAEQRSSAERWAGEQAAAAQRTGRQDVVPGWSGRQWTAEQRSSAERWAGEQAAAARRTGRQDAVPGWAGRQGRAQQEAAEHAPAQPRTGRQDAVPGWSGQRSSAERWDGERAAAAPRTGRQGPVPERTGQQWRAQQAVAEQAPGEVPAPARPGVRHPVRLALYALVLFGLLAGSVAWLAVDKSVRLTVDGEARTVSTYASTVAGVLDDAGITVSDRDVLAPAREARIADGAEIVLRRGRLLRLTIDGKTREVWVTATTVQEALDQIGYRQSGLFVSATRSERLPLEGYDLTVRTPKIVIVVADGRRQRVVTTAATVGETLDEAGVEVDSDDKVSQLATAPVVSGMTVTVTRVSRKTTTTRTVLKYDTIEKQDAEAAVGSRKVTTEGVNGLQQVTYVETYVDGKLTSRKVAKVTVLKQPVDEVVVVGPEPPPAQTAECADFPTTGGLNWCGLAKCESGLNPNAYNPAGPYYGLYQFDLGTWQAYGGTGTPSGKSIAEQTRVAYNLYLARGAAPWPVCGSNL